MPVAAPRRRLRESGARVVVVSTPLPPQRIQVRARSAACCCLRCSFSLRTRSLTCSLVWARGLRGVEGLRSFMEGILWWCWSVMYIPVYAYLRVCARVLSGVHWGHVLVVGGEVRRCWLGRDGTIMWLWMLGEIWVVAGV
jgi:hypothetical protein